MATINLGKIMLTFEGTYSSSKTYSRLSVVTYDGSAYASKTDVPAGTVPTDTAYWQLIAQKGSSLSFADLTAAQKEELARPAAEQAQAAAESLDAIQSAIEGLDPSTSTNDAIVAEAAARAAADASMQADLTELGLKIDIHPVNIASSNNSDLDISDESGNVICRFEDGHIKTKNFDSENSYNKSEVNELIQNTQQNIHLENYSEFDFAISDDEGNVILEIKKGHIITKNFNSKNKVDIFRETKLNKPLCICHGRLAATGTANTLPYFRAGVAKGYQFFECDAVSTSDGVAVCTHSYSSYTVKNRNTDENEDIQISAFTYDELIASYTWPDGTEILKTKDLIYYLCYVKKYPLWIDGQGINDTIRKDLSSYACSIGVGEYVFHEKNIVFEDLPISNCIISGTLNAMVNFANTYKNNNNNIIFHIPSTLTNEEVRQYSEAAHAIGCYACSYTFTDVSKVRDYIMNGADFIITNGITDNQI